MGGSFLKELRQLTIQLRASLLSFQEEIDLSNREHHQILDHIGTGDPEDSIRGDAGSEGRSEIALKDQAATNRLGDPSFRNRWESNCRLLDT